MSGLPPLALPVRPPLPLPALAPLPSTPTLPPAPRPRPRAASSAAPPPGHAAFSRGEEAQGIGPPGFTAAAPAGGSGQAGAGGGQGGGASGSGDTGGGETSDDAAALPLDVRLRHVGDAVAMVCRYESAQCVWSARIPLDAGLLPGTVLFLSYSPGLLALRFQTTDWESRDLLLPQLEALEALVAACLPPDCGVAISL